jgi:tetratricopeptide (TPR) repeat protein
MTSIPLNRHLDTQIDPQKEYRALIRSLKYTEGFGLLFVQCSFTEGNRLIERVKQDLPQKHIEVLSLTQPIDTLFDKVEQIYHDKLVDVLFVQGLEHSLYDYEKHRLWSDEAQRLNYSETGVPRLLQHLNLSREKFHASFPFHFVFLVPSFVLKYLIRRAPDFFDWNSGVLEFPMEQRQLRNETEQAYRERLLKDNPQNLTPEECRESLLKIQDLIEEPHQSEEDLANLLFEQAQLFDIAGEEEAAIASYEHALQFKLDYDLTWFGLGNTLSRLGRYEAAIASYEHALQFKPDKNEAWNNRGNALAQLGRYEEAIASYDKALQFKPDKDSAWNSRGYALDNIGRYEEAIASYDKALQFKPDADAAWYNRGNALFYLGRYEEAIASYDKALQFKPDKDSAWNNRGNALDNIGRYEEAIASYDKALQFKPGDELVWNNRGYALANLGRHEEAIASYSKVLELTPQDDNAFYNKACCYALQSNHEKAIANLSQAIALSPDKYRELAKTDPDFDSIRDNEDFKSLLYELSL